MAFEQHEFSPGEKIGSYKVLRPLGMGAAGTVYEAEHELTGKSPKFVIYGKEK